MPWSFVQSKAYLIPPGQTDPTSLTPVLLEPPTVSIHGTSQQWLGSLGGDVSRSHLVGIERSHGTGRGTSEKEEHWMLWMDRWTDEVFVVASSVQLC